MKILDQKLGNVGAVHISVESGKLVIAVEGDLDLIQQLEKLRETHSSGLVGSLIVAAEDAIKVLTAAPAVAVAAEEAPKA